MYAGKVRVEVVVFNTVGAYFGKVLTGVVVLVDAVAFTGAGIAAGVVAVAFVGAGVAVGVAFGV